MIEVQKIDITLRQLIVEDKDILGLMVLNMQAQTVIGAAFPSHFDVANAARYAFSLYDSSNTLYSLFNIHASEDKIHLFSEDAFHIMLLKGEEPLWILIMYNRNAKLGLLMLNVKNSLKLL